MGCISDGKITMIGNFAKVSRKKPKNWHDRDYKVIVSWDEAFPKGMDRPKLGKAVCDCKEVLECYQPYYGWNWYHSDECAVIKHIKRWPQMQNFFWDTDLTLIAIAG